MDTLKRMKENREYLIYAYCLRDNQTHLLLEELQYPIRRSMKRIGQLFRDRYKSQVVEYDEYLLECAIYMYICRRGHEKLLL